MTDYKAKVEAMKSELDKVVSGYDHVKKQVLICLLSRGHVLLRAVPGTAKTTLAKTLRGTVAGATDARFQMTPDMKPSDILGAIVYNVKTGEFENKPGQMVGRNIVLLDEINRTTPKTLSATLQAMQEGTITLGEKTYKLEDLFFVMATMNPVEQEGTFSLPEATLDRFAMLLDMRYVSRADELRMLENVIVHGTKAQNVIENVVSVEEILEMREAVNAIAANASPTLRAYIVDLGRATRPEDEAFDRVHNSRELGEGLSTQVLKDSISLGGSPRVMIWTLHCAAAHAFISGRQNIEPDDVKAVFRDVARHRIILTQMAEHDGLTADKVIDAVLSRVEVIPEREGR
jgi:MoxR-like ATPase